MERDKDAAAQLLGRQSCHLLPALRVSPSLFPREATTDTSTLLGDSQAPTPPALLLFGGCSSPTTQPQGWSSAMEKGTESRWGCQGFGGGGWKA